MMNLEPITSYMKKYGIFYLLGMVLLVSIKYYFSTADSHALLWILTPTAKWVGILGGIRFSYEPQIGYISREYQFLLAPSCSGVLFLVITAAVLLYPFLHKCKTTSGCLLWMLFGFGFSYVFTIFVNGIRVVLAVFLPVYLRDTAFFATVMTPERLHTAIGITVYFTSLFLLYQTVDRIFSGTGKAPTAAPAGLGPLCNVLMRRCVPPLLCYLLLTLVLPILRGAFLNDLAHLLSYAGLLLILCLAVVLLFGFLPALRQHLKCRKKMQG